MTKTKRGASGPRTRGARDFMPAERLLQRSARRSKLATASPAKSAGKRLTQTERVALSDSRMLEAAVQLIYDRGTSNTTLKDVGQIAGYSRGLASSRFGSKDALFFELLDQFNRRWKEDSATAVGLKTGLDAFRNANKGLISFFKNEAKFIRVMYLIAYETVGSSELMRKQLSGQHEAYRHGIARWLRDAIAAGEVKKSISPERIAVQYVASVFGIIYQWLVNPEVIDCTQALDDLRENILQVIKA
jgi:AcrR family transcriptional regulator